MDSTLEDVARFVEVARILSFTAAADRLDMTVSSLSRHVRSLERGIGLRLLNRTTRRVELTEAGQTYYNRCAALVDELRLAHRDLKTSATVPVGRLRVSTSADFGTRLAPLLVEFHAVYPQVRVDLDLSSRRADLLVDPIDVALRMGPIDDTSLIARPLAALRVALYAAPAYLARSGTPRAPRDLGRHSCLAMNGNRPATTWSLAKGLRRESVTIDGAFSANSMALLRQLALAGMGIATLDALMVREDLAQGHLVEVLRDWTVDRVPVHALLPAYLIPAKTRVFVDFLADRLAASDAPRGRRRPARTVG